MSFSLSYPALRVMGRVLFLRYIKEVPLWIKRTAVCSVPWYWFRAAGPQFGSIYGVWQAPKIAMRRNCYET